MAGGGVSLSSLHSPLLLLLSLSVCCVLLLARPSLAKTDAPCQRSKWNNGFSTFLRRHLRSGMPGSLDQNAWFKFIRDSTDNRCNRPTQSFIHPAELEQVKAVCSGQGGRIYKDNLCISRKPFTFVTVRSEPNTCGIKSVREETKYLILACENVDNQCVPVHFEGNPNDAKPDNNARACQDPDKAQDPDEAQDPGKAGATAVSTTACLWLLASVMVLIVNNAH